jgi:hypothetical protein
VTLTATFIEEITQKEVKVTKEVAVEKTPYKLELTAAAHRIKPGLPFTVRAYVSHHDKDMPVTDSHNPVKFTIKYNYNILMTCSYKEYPKWFDPFFRSRNKNSSVTQRTLTVDELVTVKYKCREIKFNVEVKDVYPKNGIADVHIDIYGNITDVQVKVSEFCSFT